MSRPGLDTFIDYMGVLEEIMEKQKDLYFYSDGAIELDHMYEYTRLKDKYVELIAKVFDFNKDDLIFFVVDCELGNAPQEVIKGRNTYLLECIEDAYEWLSCPPENCECFMNYFDQDGVLMYSRCMGTKEQDICTCNGKKEACDFYTFDREGHSHPKYNY